MVSTVKVDVVAPRVATGTTTLGVSGDKLLIPSGVTITNSGTASGFASGLSSVQAFTATATWTRPTDITKVVVEVQGGGAGGSRDSTGVEQIGGSAGGYAKKLLDVSSITTSTITIGAAGTGGATDGAAGTDGGDSSWADGTNTISGLKGVGGNTANTRNIGGLGTGGDINIQGGDGGRAIDNRAGSSQFGHGGCNWSTTTGQNDATGYGAGGGAMESSGGAGGDGTAGIVMVWEYK